MMIASSAYREPLSSMPFETMHAAPPTHILLILLERAPRAEVDGLSLEKPVALVDVGEGLLQVIHAQLDLLLLLQTRFNQHVMRGGMMLLRGGWV